MASSKKPAGRVAGRENDTGRFVKVGETRERPKETTREILPLPGHGDTGRYDKKQH